VTFTDLQGAVGQTPRRFGYVRNNVADIWVAGSGQKQIGFSRALAGALLLEADEFFDRALVLFLIRTRLRAAFASSWASVAVYYSNYFLASSFNRLHFHGVTHLPGGALYDIEPVLGRALQLQVTQRTRRLGHREIWKQYYTLVTQMAWPSPAEVMLLAPIALGLQYREQDFRERVNYRPGEGFAEIYLSAARYRDVVHGVRTVDRSLPIGPLGDDAYNDRLAAERLGHVARLMRRLEEHRVDPDIEVQRWRQRDALVERYGASVTERRFARALLAG